MKYRELWIYEGPKYGVEWVVTSQKPLSDKGNPTHVVEASAYDAQITINKALQDLLKELEPMFTNAEKITKVVERLLAEIKMNTDKVFYEHCLNKVKELMEREG